MAVSSATFNHHRQTIPGVRKANSRRWQILALGMLALVLPACESGGHFTMLGYSTLPNYDPSICTVYVPIFENRTFRRGIEFDVTRAVVRTIEEKTPFKVVHDPMLADTELRGTIVAFNKAILNRNQLNEVREAETLLTVEVIWTDRRTGEVLSAPGPRPDAVGPMPGLLVPDGAQSMPGAIPVPPTLPAPQLVEGQPAIPVQAGPPPKPPTLVRSFATFIPELGASMTTSEQTNVNRLAEQIVSLMEMPW